MFEIKKKMVGKMKIFSIKIKLNMLMIIICICVEFKGANINFIDRNESIGKINKRIYQ